MPLWDSSKNPKECRSSWCFSQFYEKYYYRPTTSFLKCFNPEVFQILDIYIDIMILKGSDFRAPKTFDFLQRNV